MDHGSLHFLGHETQASPPHLGEPSSPLPVDAARVAMLIRDAGALTRAELGQELGLSRTALQTRIDVLQRLGLVAETSPRASSGGRPASQLEFTPRTGFVAGIDLGARAVDIAITDLAARPLLHRSARIDTTRGPEESLAVIGEMLDGLLSEPGVVRDRMRGIGIGIPAPVKAGAGLSVSPTILPGWEGFDVAGPLHARYGVPVYVENDANLMALGEAWAGVARAAADFLWVKLGSGIGCGIVARGRIVRGAQGCAGDIGHIAVGTETARCGCGGVGCLEAVAGGDALTRRAIELARGGGSPALGRLLASRATLGPLELAAAVDEGDRAAMTLVRTAGDHVGAVLASLVSFFNPSLIVIGGVVARIGDSLLAAIRESVYRRSAPLATRDLVVTATGPGGMTGVIGAAAFVLGRRYHLLPGSSRASARSSCRPSRRSAAT